MARIYEKRRRVQTSLLYQAARLRASQGGFRASSFHEQEYELPFSEEFVLITVVVQKSPLKLTRKKASATGVRDDDPIVDEDTNKSGQQGNSYAQHGQRKYYHVTLMDLGRGSPAARLLGNDSLQGGGGDEQLEMMLFESDTREEKAMKRAKLESGLETRFEKDTYQPSDYDSFRGGSGGAYEKLHKEPEGTVIALINPRLMSAKAVSSFEKS